MDDRLELLLRDARPAFPPTPELAAVVVERLASGSPVPARPERPSRSPLEPRPRLRVALLLAASLALLLGAGAVAAGALGIGPLRIWFTDAPLPSTGPEGPLGARLALGDRITLEEARSVGPPLLEPVGVGPADEAYRSASGIVSLVWRPGEGLPSAGPDGIALLVMAIPGDLDPDLVSKIVVESRAAVRPVAVRGRDGFWISGAPHVLRLIDPAGEQTSVTSRLAGDTLVWGENGTVYRIETPLGLEAATRLADGARPPP
jgi:hypothetical protein